MVASWGAKKGSNEVEKGQKKKKGVQLQPLEQIRERYGEELQPNNNLKVIPKFAKCNNCDSLHYIYDICKSELKGGKDQSLMINTIDDMLISLPEKLTNLLIKLNCDISVWEHCLDIIQS